MSMIMKKGLSYMWSRTSIDRLWTRRKDPSLALAILWSMMKQLRSPWDTDTPDRLEKDEVRAGQPPPGQAACPLAALPNLASTGLYIRRVDGLEMTNATVRWSTHTRSAACLYCLAVELGPGHSKILWLVTVLLKMPPQQLFPHKEASTYVARKQINNGDDGKLVWARWCYVRFSLFILNLSSYPLLRPLSKSPSRWTLRQPL